jgi:hypothetical protein
MIALMLDIIGNRGKSSLARAVPVIYIAQQRFDQ